MHFLRTFVPVATVAACSALLSTEAQAASLQQVNGWEIGGLPSDVTMYSYVPDNVVANPPVLVLIHFCGGPASAVFEQARGGGLIAKADEHGFIIVTPSNDGDGEGRCWDVRSDVAWTRDGGGDSHAIRQMVTYAIDTYGANSDRVYATGDSSGGMMTELLLGLYPDVFKAGSAMAGMPAGCRGANENGTDQGYSGACAGGNVDLTPEEWGAVVDSLSPDYTGLRPRVQLFHGDQDNIISFKNHTEAIEEWRDVLGLGETPTQDQSGLTLGTHSATRATWEADCGYPVLDAFTSLGGDHGPSDALFLAEYVIPFLGLDQVGDVDPYVQACDVPDIGGSGGANGVGGSNGAGGSEGVGGGAVTGGAPGVGGAPSGGGTGGAPSGVGGGVTSATGGSLIDSGVGGTPSSNDGSSDTGSSSNSSDTGGCAIGVRPTSSYWLVLVAAGLLLGRRRRGERA